MRTAKKANYSKEKHVYTEEERLALSIKMTGENNPFFGKHHTEETKRIIGEKNRNREHIMTERWAKQLESISGKKSWTEETYKKIKQLGVDKRGEKCVTSKLSNQDVIDILVRIKNGEKQRDLANEYHV